MGVTHWYLPCAHCKSYVHSESSELECVMSDHVPSAGEMSRRFSIF